MDRFYCAVFEQEVEGLGHGSVGAVKVGGLGSVSEEFDFFVHDGVWFFVPAMLEGAAVNYCDVFVVVDLDFGAAGAS